MKNVLLVVSILLALPALSSAQSLGQARVYAAQTACDLQNKISPHTGYDCDYEIFDYDYHAYSGEYIIYMEATWTAKTCMLCSTRNTCLVTGKLYVNPNQPSKARFKRKTWNDWTQKCANSHIYDVMAAAAFLALELNN